ncbi:dehydrodolichyl diphosphate synthase subunit [Lycorma delicatula]|uniref:dehydrodolichyl diphosphate synthase subunit n=1 Tax=Lycorma delicatula TaxID=130591 RepID=UPI003F5152D6
MSWITQSSLNWFQRCCIKLLKCGPIPKHVAFIMDGNRRYAKKNNVKKIDGHTKGFHKLSETLQWCLDLGIEEVTVYAFSIENFKRSEEEVDALLELARQKFQRLLDECDKLMEKGVRIRVIGNWSLLPENIVKMISEAELRTKDNTNCYLNVAFAYTARDEVTHAVRTIVNGVSEGLLEEQDITSELLSHCFYTGSSPEPDLLIRTSGETRLSDFLLWQVSYSYLYFTDVLWPDFTAWDLISAVFHYQHSYSKLQYAKEQQKLRQNYEIDTNLVDFNRIGITKNAENFLRVVDNRYWEAVRKNLVS